MLALITGMIPICLAAAVSPVMVSEQTMLMAGSGGRRGGAAYALGTVSVVVAFGLVVLSVGRSLELPSAPKLTAGMDIGLGAVLIGLAALLRLLPHRPSTKKKRTHSHDSMGGAFGFGVFSMATNFTTLALVIAVVKEIAASGVGFIGATIAFALLVLFACLPAWAPLALVSIAPTRGTKALADLKAYVDQHGRRLANLIVFGAGAYLVARGAIRLGLLG